MPNRIDEFADAFIGWMDEWQQKRKTEQELANLDDLGIRLPASQQVCALCHKDIQRGFARYWRGNLLHDECWIPFITAQRMESRVSARGGSMSTATKKKRDPETEPDWTTPCEVCGEVPTVPATGMCGPCTFGEAETAGGNW